jgi:hypothetical protein
MGNGGHLRMNGFHATSQSINLSFSPRFIRGGRIRKKIAWKRIGEQERNKIIMSFSPG